MRFVPLFLMLCAASPALADNLLVLESNVGSEFTQGQMIDGELSISIPAGRRVVLMNEAGVAVTINGPYQGRPGGAAQHKDSTLLGRIAALIQSARKGGVAPKSIGIASPAFDPWVIDVISGGTKCAKPGSAPLLWRRAPLDSTTLSLSRGEDPPVNVKWPEDLSTVVWPNDVPVVDNGTYLVQVAAANSQRNFFKLRVRASSPESDGAALDWLMGAGCMDQAKALLAQLGRAHVVEGSAVSGKDVFAGVR